MYGVASSSSVAAARIVTGAAAASAAAGAPAAHSAPIARRKAVRCIDDAIYAVDAAIPANVPRMNSPRHDAAVIVVGGGHAGFEAALAAARLGAETLLITGDPERICTLACNPSIGGSAKGQLVREIDALGGEMARVADATSLHARFLNESKGPSVRALRVLADKPGYVRAARAVVEATPNLTVVNGMAEDLLLHGDAVAGVVLGDGRM